MNMAEVIGAAATAVLTMLAMAWINARTVDDRAVRSQGMVHLRPWKAYPLIGVITILIGLVMALSPFLPPPYGMDGPWGIQVMVVVVGVLFLLIPGLMVLLIGLNHEVLYTDKAVLVRDVLRREHRFTWDEIAGGRFGAVGRDAVLKLRDGRVVRINLYLVGAADFLKELARRTSLPALEWRKRMV